MEKAEKSGKGCCRASIPTKQQSSTSTSTDTWSGCVPAVSSKWSWRDRWGQIRCRLGNIRHDYKVAPELYAIGSPGKSSDVFVTANYKLTFDILRKSLKRVDAWLLVLDTKGINVWCAAGKGTFSTEELIEKIKKANLKNVVNHNRLIVPQLGAVGISAHEITEKTAFKVLYGPVRSKDIRAYLKNNYTAAKDMRQIKFPLKDRLILIPIELYQPWKKFLSLSLFTLLIFGLQPSGILFSNILNEGFPIVVLGAISIISGALLVPALLPILPSRSFAVKGFIMGLITPVIALLFSGYTPFLANIYIIIFCWLLYPMISSYMGLQFTGASTFTSMSGVKKELKIGLPIYIVSIAVSIILIVLFKLSAWGIL